MAGRQPARTISSSPPTIPLTVARKHSPDSCTRGVCCSALIACNPAHVASNMSADSVSGLAAAAPYSMYPDAVSPSMSTLNGRLSGGALATLTIALTKACKRPALYA
eukprot:5188203-Prymnesium_polylepis.3